MKAPPKTSRLPGTILGGHGWMKTPLKRGMILGVAPRAHNLGKLQIGMLDDASPSRNQMFGLKRRQLLTEETMRISDEELLRLCGNWSFNRSHHMVPFCLDPLNS